jgi:hypothetical protein
MKKQIYYALTSFLLFGCASQPANTTEPENRVSWKGTVKCHDRARTDNHAHRAVFIREKDQETFDIVDSSDFVDRQCTSKTVSLLDIEGELTSRFLFWGGNLIVKQYSVAEQLNQPTTHEVAPIRSHSSSSRSTPRRR